MASAWELKGHGFMGSNPSPGPFRQPLTPGCHKRTKK